MKTKKVLQIKKISFYSLLTFIPMAGIAKIKVEEKPIEQKPNILVIVCEDISPSLGCYGDAVAVTPNLDGFSKQAILHTDMYTCVGVSAPSRYSLITGRYASSDAANYMRSNYFNKEFGVVPPAGVKCYTEYLRQNGYYCTNNAKTDYQFPAPESAWNEQGESASWKHAPSDSPFFSIYNLNITHESQIWKNTDQPLAVSPDVVVVPPYYPDTKIVRHDHAVNYTNIKKMDEQFKALLVELENSDRADNTIVVFYADNGGPLPRAKREIMDSGTKVPFMIRFPNREGEGSINHELNMFVDIPATILSMAGIQPPSNMHGQAMYGKYKAKKNRKFVFGATDRFDEQIEKRASIRSNRFLYIKNYMPNQSVYRPVRFRLDMPMMREMLQLYEDGKLNEVQSRWFKSPTYEEELYDCISDPHQVHNLIGSPKYKKVLKAMRKAYRKEWITPFNKEWEVKPEEYFVNKMWPNGVKPVCESPRVRREDKLLFIDNDMTIYSAVYKKEGEKLWNLYTCPITVSNGEKIKVKLERIGYTPSEKEY